MQFGINLLPRKKATPGEKAILGRIRFLAGLVLVLYIVFIGVLLASSFYLSSWSKKLEIEKKQIEGKVKNLEKRETQALTLKQRMEIIGEILAAREKAHSGQVSQEQLLTWIRGFVLPGISLKEVNISIQEVTFAGEAINVLALGEFLDQFQGLGKKISYLTLDSLSRSAKGIYSFSFKAYLF